MKLVLLSDVHWTSEQPVARKDNAFETLQRKMDYVFSRAAESNASILQAGDLFNSPRHWGAMNSMIEFLSEWKNQGVQVYCIAGQHDTYLYQQEAKPTTALGALERAGLVRMLNRELINQIPFGELGWSIRGVSYGQEIPRLEYRESGEVLVIHAMITDRPLWPGQEDYTDAGKFLDKYMDYDLILCGDAHRYFMIIGEDGRIICNTGPILRREASEGMFEHHPGFFVYDTETRDIVWEEIPHEPAEDVLSRKHIERKEERNEMLECFMGAMVEDVEMGVSFRENLEKFLGENPAPDAVRRVLAEVMEEK